MASKSRKGFTLVEILIALFSLSILLTALFGFYMQVRGVVYEQTRASQSGNRAINAIRILTRDLQNLVDEPWNERYFFKVKKGASLGVKNDYLNFISGDLYSNPSLMQTRVYNVAYYGKIDEENGRVDLIRTEDIFADFEETARGIEVPLLENITEFTAEFSLNAKDWRDDWDMVLMKRPPPFIRITLGWQEEENPRRFQFQISPGIFY